MPQKVNVVDRGSGPDRIYDAAPPLDVCVALGLVNVADGAGYHCLGCGKTMALMGKAFAEAVAEMEKK